MSDLLRGKTTKNSNSNSNENQTNTNELAPLPFFPFGNASTGMQVMSLGPSSSSATAEWEYEEYQRRMKEQKARNKPYGKKIPFTDALLVDIVDKLTPCPQGEFATRVFRQHIDMGLCWHDSFFMMLFENEHFKAKSVELLQEFFLELNINKISTLEFDKTKTHVVAKALKASRKSELDIGTWEIVTLALQRYALLGLMFVKESQAEVLTKPVESSRLLNRRPSLGEMNFNSIHNLLKYGVMRCFESGASKSGIQTFMYRMDNFLKELTNGAYTMQDATNPLEPLTTAAYYFSIQANAQYESPNGFVGGAHIISFFVCNKIWFLYDNETGVLPLSKEQSSAIQTYGIESVQILAERDMFVYPITLGNKETFSVEMPHVDTSWNKKPGVTRIVRARVVKDSSFRIVAIKKPNSITSTAAGETKNGGHRSLRN